MKQKVSCNLDRYFKISGTVFKIISKKFTNNIAEKIGKK